MSILSEIKELKYKHVLVGVVVFLGVLAPGFLALYQFRPALVEKLDTMKLVIFSCALTLPVLVANIGILWSIDEGGGQKEREEVCILALFLSMVMLYLAVGVAHFGGLSFRHYFGFLALFILFGGLAARQMARELKTSRKPGAKDAGDPGSGLPGASPPVSNQPKTL